MNGNTEIQKDDEISLLDLFIILLRYRKLIAGITLAFIILAAVGYFIYPAYRYKKALANVQTQGIMKLEIEQKAQAYVSQSLDNFILRPDVIYNSLYTAGMDGFSYNDGKISLDDNNKATIMNLINLFWIQNIDLKGSIYARKENDKIFNVKKVENLPANDNNSNEKKTERLPVIEIMFKDKDSKMLKNFMESLINSCTISVDEELRTNAKMIVDNYERIMNMPKISESMQIMLEKDFDIYVYLKSVLEGKASAVKLVSGPVLVEPVVSLSLYKSQFKKPGIIIVFAGFFLAVMSAFVLNTISNIKNDEEVMKKIKDALGNSSSK